MEEEGYDVEKWGTPEEWDKAVNSFGNNIAALTDASIQQRVQDRRGAAQQGHNEARK
jgi:hypothetical protein